MTRHDDFIGQLDGYLDEYEGSTPLPEDVRNAIRAQLPSIQQRPAWWPARRFPDMNNTVRIALAGAAVVAVALLGIQFFAPGAGIGGPDEATPTDDPTPTESPEAATIVIGEGFLEYAEVTTPKPDGWTLEANFASKDGTASDGMGFSAWTTDAVYPDPCQWEGDVVELSTPPTVDEIVAALVAQTGRDPSTPTDVTLGGWAAKRFELVTPADLDISTCDQGRYKTWTDTSDPNGGNWNHQSGQFDVIYVVDVDRGPVVIDAWYNLSTSEADLAELEAVIEAMVIDVQ
jgi:hypothetical protein